MLHFQQCVGAGRETVVTDSQCALAERVQCRGNHGYRFERHKVNGATQVGVFFFQPFCPLFGGFEELLDQLLQEKNRGFGICKQHPSGQPNERLRRGWQRIGLILAEPVGLRVIGTLFRKQRIFGELLFNVLGNFNRDRQGKMGWDNQEQIVPSNAENLKRMNPILYWLCIAVFLPFHTNRPQMLAKRGKDFLLGRFKYGAGKVLIDRRGVQGFEQGAHVIAIGIHHANVAARAGGWTDLTQILRLHG